MIDGGYLNSPIVDQDIYESREIRMPFNIKENLLRGSMFRMEGMKYPDPFIVHLQLKHK